MPVGYSGTPIVKKLGIGPGARVAVLGKPVKYGALLGVVGAETGRQEEAAWKEPRLTLNLRADPAGRTPPPITVVIFSMALAQSKLTAQGQISVPAEVRRRLGVGPGSVLEWDADGDQIVVRRKGRYSSEDIHKVLFPNGPPKRRSLAELKQGISKRMRARHARD